MDTSGCNTLSDISSKFEEYVQEHPETKWPNISGKWKNQHDSIMTIVPNEDGTLTGSYESGVSQPGGPVRATNFTGLYQATEFGFLISFIALFEIEKDERIEGSEETRKVPRHTNTVWNGVLNYDDMITLKTTWLMKTEKSPAEDWLSQLTNVDVFDKLPVDKVTMVL